MQLWIGSGRFNAVFSNTSDNTEGHMIVDCTLEGPVQGVRGSGVLATITFRVMGAGQSTLDLYNVTLLAANEMGIPC